jgi:membrane-bound serine protease (ClpP class)
MLKYLMTVAFVLTSLLVVRAEAAAPSTVTVAGAEPYVAVIDMNMMILPGTAAFLSTSIEEAAATGAKALVVRLSTPGGSLTSCQDMVQHIFSSPIPVIMYVSPSGGTATSAGVFITLAGHVAAMAPGTSMGSAHPVQGDGKDIEGDMRQKAEQMAIALVKSIADQRGRNVAWAEKAVKESSSITEKEALEMNVVDFVAEDVTAVLKKAAGKQVKVGQSMLTLDDLSALPQRTLEMSLKHKTLNVFANPTIAALLWLGATTGLSIELYNPGAILPGVVGVICLILALAVSEVLPINFVGVLLFVVGSLLIGLEFIVPSGILGIGGVIAIVLGAIYLIDVSQAPDLAVAYELIIPAALIFGGALLFVVRAGMKAMRRQASTGTEGLVGQRGRAIATFTSQGKVYVNGEIWDAACTQGIIEKGAEIEVTAVREGLLLEVRKV